MKVYNIEITETLQKLIQIKASSEDEALRVVIADYNNEKIILDESNFLEKEIEIYKS